MTRAARPFILPSVAVLATGAASIYYYVTDDVLRAIYWLIVFGLMWKWLSSVLDDFLKEHAGLLGPSDVKS